MIIQFLTAAVGPLCKKIGIAPGVNEPYPKASKITTHDEEITLDEAGMTRYHALLKEYAGNGAALYKGLTTRPLKNESRKGLTDKMAPSHLLVLDIDGLKLNTVSIPGVVNLVDVMRVAESVVSLLPGALRTTSYVAVASSSFGLKGDSVNMHLHFLLSHAVSPQALKPWLRSLNITIEEVRDQLALTPSLQAIKSVIDPCLAESARIVYMAPPLFGDHAANPFADDADRIVLVKKASPTIDIRPLITETNLATVTAALNKKRAELLKLLGVSTRHHKTTTLKTKQGTVEVVIDPHQIALQYAAHDDQYVRYNVNGGDSNAYWVNRDNPTIVYCFKPDEKPFLFEKANPEMYEWHVQQYGGPATLTEDDEGKSRAIRPLLVNDFNSDNLYRIEYDPKEDEVVRMAVVSREHAEHWMRSFGMPMPDTYPQGELVMDPTKLGVLRKYEDRLVINQFQASRYLKHNEGEPMPADMKTAHALLGMCPQIYSILAHMLNYDDGAIERFINWLAYIWQERRKAETAWLIHGTQGTGKGYLFHRILRPLFAKHAVMKTLERIADDQFNAWEETALVVMVDEFNLSDVSSGTRKAANKLKNMVTEPTTTLRKMRTDQQEVPSWSSFIFATNDIGALQIDAGDRRYNVAPRQEVKLVHVMPDINADRVNFDARTESELHDFAAYLTVFDVNLHMVRQPYEGGAKEAAIEAAMDSTTRFFKCVMSGDLGEFIPDLLAKPNELLAREQTLIQGVKGVIKRWLLCANKGTALVPVSDLRLLYSYRAGKDITQNAMSRMLTSHAVPVTRLRKQYLETNTAKTSGVEVNWLMDPGELQDTLAQLNMVQGVSPLNKVG
ncbi:hypothetical protein HNR62_000340 [Oceanisphaera litoralis]|uniref:primase-helicase family protein n=1 Tax=Oceanisphaera litoralis TaxID=225144 RepID=UPI0019578BF0|nr:primase-helicase family protein [Oceanisphaera litoralis]MBM7454511.1 hypothetical protein [Oceanisphaera litoralis]